MHSYLFIVITIFSLLTLGCDLQAEEPQSDSTSPVALFENVDQPASQTSSASEMLTFLPEVLVTYGDGSVISKNRVIDEMDMGLNMAVQQDRPLSREEIVSIVHQLIESIININMIVELATDSGIKADLSAAKIEVEKMKTAMGKPGFSEMLKIQGITESEFQWRLSRMSLANQWIEQVVIGGISISPEEIATFYNDNADIFSEFAHTNRWHMRVKINNSDSGDFTPEIVSTGTSTDLAPLDDHLKGIIREQLIEEKVARHIQTLQQQWKEKKKIRFNF